MVLPLSTRSMPRAVGLPDLIMCARFVPALWSLFPWWSGACISSAVRCSDFISWSRLLLRREPLPPSPLKSCFLDSHSLSTLSLLYRWQRCLAHCGWMLMWTIVKIVSLTASQTSFLATETISSPMSAVACFQLIVGLTFSRSRKH